ncbi:unnamed protein product, partial [Dibothriocephalus latus]
MEAWGDNGAEELWGKVQHMGNSLGCLFNLRLSGHMIGFPDLADASRSCAPKEKDLCKIQINFRPLARDGYVWQRESPLEDGLLPHPRPSIEVIQNPVLERLALHDFSSGDSYVRISGINDIPACDKPLEIYLKKVSPIDADGMVLTFYDYAKGYGVTLESKNDTLISTRWDSNLQHSDRVKKTPLRVLRIDREQSDWQLDKPLAEDCDANEKDNMVIFLGGLPPGHFELRRTMLRVAKASIVLAVESAQKVRAGFAIAMAQSEYAEDRTLFNFDLVVIRSTLKVGSLWLRVWLTSDLRVSIAVPNTPTKLITTEIFGTPVINDPANNLAALKAREASVFDQPLYTEAVLTLHFGDADSQRLTVLFDQRPVQTWPLSKPIPNSKALQVLIGPHSDPSSSEQYRHEVSISNLVVGKRRRSGSYRFGGCGAQLRPRFVAKDTLPNAPFVYQGLRLPSPPSGRRVRSIFELCDEILPATQQYCDSSNENITK